MADVSLDIDKLTDFEIRDKLKDLGCTFGTEAKTNRKTLSAKLKKILREQTARSPNLQGNPSLMHYSSGDDTQSGEELPKSPRSPSRKKSHQPEKDSFINPSTSLEFTTNKQNIRVSTERRSNFDFSDSDTDIDIETNEDATPNIHESSHMVPPSFLRDNEPHESDKKVTRGRRKVAKDRSHIPPTRDVGSQRSCVEHEANTNGDRDAPHRKRTPQYTCPPLYQHLIRTRLPQEERRRRHDKVQILINLITLIGLVSIVYYVFTQNFSENLQIEAFHSDKNYYPICGQENVDSSVCVEDVQLMPALDLANILVPKLREDAVEAYCSSDSYGKPVAVPSISEEDALAYIQTKLSSRKPTELQKDLKNFKILVLSNPHWEVKVVANGMKDIEKILFYGEFMARQFTLPISCYVLRIVFKIPSVILLTGMVVTTAGLCISGYRMYKRVHDEHMRNVHRIVHNISQAVYEQERDVNTPNYISIENCRDLVLHLEPEPVSIREWEDAVAFVKKHEPRIRTEVRHVRGELVKVWIWVPPPKEPNFSE